MMRRRDRRKAARRRPFVQRRVAGLPRPVLRVAGCDCDRQYAMRDAQITAQAGDEIGLLRTFRPEAMIDRRRLDPAR